MTAELTVAEIREFVQTCTCDHEQAAHLIKGAPADCVYERCPCTRFEPILTSRQAHVLELRQRGFSQTQVALGLHISRTTVRYLETRARQKIAIHRSKAA